MKIRTDFVTNSSSSSFVVATITSNSKELLDAIDSIEYNLEFGEYIQTDGEDTITMRLRESALGFNYLAPMNPQSVVQVLLDNIAKYGDKELFSGLAGKASNLAESIQKYDIVVGEAGSNGTAECLWDDYIEWLSDGDEDKRDELQDEAYETNEWAQKESCYSFKKGDSYAKLSVSFSGPLE